MPSGRNVSDPTWTPLLTPTPNHQDYLSTHATFGGAAAAVIRDWNGGDAVDVSLSSNVTVDGVGVVTRRITSLSEAAKENGDSRVFGGVSLLRSGDDLLLREILTADEMFRGLVDTFSIRFGCGNTGWRCGWSGNFETF